METQHIPVLVSQVVKLLKASEGGRFLDCTLGGGGHSLAILKANEANTVVGVDRDLRAIERCRKSIGESKRFQIVHADFSGLLTVLKSRNFDGMLADLGVSTFQFLEGRGFSFNEDSPLDMRMNENDKLTAADVVNTYSPRDLFAVLKNGGVGRDARRITDTIVRSRPLKSTAELAVAARSAASRRMRERAVDPATVVFQAIRMEVNRELSQLTSLMNAAPELVVSGGRLAVITFHSLEDRIVARTIRRWDQGSEVSASWPGAGREQDSLGRVIGRKGVVPLEDEIRRNPRARSAKLRVFEFH